MSAVNALNTALDFLGANLVALPLAIPLITAALAMLAWRSRPAQRAIAAAGSALHVAAAAALTARVLKDGHAVLKVGAWEAPFGVVFAADIFGALMVLIGAVIGLATVIYSLASMDPERESFGYYPLLHTLLMGISGAFLTGDLFNLYVWFEVLLMSSFVLICLGGERAQIEGAIKYVTINLMSSAVFLAAAGLVYAELRTLNMADLALAAAAHPQPGVVTVLAVMFFVAFGIKAAVFPLYAWLPSSYHTPPAAVSAIFAGMLTKVGVYALVRVFCLIFTGDTGFTHTLIIWTAGFTMIFGVLGAMSQNEMRKILSFHIVSQIGYMIMGLGIGTPLALAGTVFYVIHHILVKTNLFLVAGIVNRRFGSFELKQLGGAYARAPWLAALFLIPALSLAGIPPLSGFFAKFSLAKAGFEAGHYGVVAASFVAGLLTLYSMTKIWNEVFWKAAPAGSPAAEAPRPAGWLWTAPVAALALATVLIGLGGEKLMTVASRAGDQLTRPAVYVEAVLGPEAAARLEAAR
jgi:multicomponent Na+:H+ antiporter subunit D